MDGTWSSKPRRRPWRAVLGIVALAAVVAVSLYASNLRHELAQRAGTPATPVPSHASTR